MPGTYYAVRIGRKSGIYSSWSECKLQTSGFAGSKFQAFTSLERATKWIQEAPPIATIPETQTKKKRKLCQLKVRGTPAARLPIHLSFNQSDLHGAIASLGIIWYTKQAFALDSIERLHIERRDEEMLVKMTNFKFGHIRKKDLASRYLLISPPTPGVYEVVERDRGGPKRLYFDVEAEYAEWPASPQRWLQGLLVLLRQTIQTLRPSSAQQHLDDRTWQEALKVCVTNDSRRTATTCKLSFHLVFPNLFMARHETEMRSFVCEHVLPVLRNSKEFCWLAIHKNGETSERVAVDPAVYANRQAFRLTWACKKPGDRGLVPWDVDKWETKYFASDEERMDWFLQSLISHSYSADNQNVLL